jgi:hypothetical protein
MADCVQSAIRYIQSLADEPKILAAIEVKVAIDEVEEVVAALEAHGVGSIAQPTVKLCAYAHGLKR